MTLLIIIIIMSNQENNQGFKRVQYKRSKNNNTTARYEQEIKNLQKRIYSPKVDLIERDTYYFVKIELPAVDKDTLKVSIRDDQFVLISGSKYQDDILDTDHVIYRESKFKDFNRRVKLPSIVEPFDNVLDLENGVLKLRFYKKSSSDQSVDTITQTLDTLKFSNENISWADV